MEAFGNAASTANFICSGNNDTFNRTNDNSGDVTATYKFYAIGFGTVNATPTGSNATANFFDSPGNNTFTEVAPTTGILAGTNYSVKGTGFRTVTIFAGLGSTDTIVRDAITYTFAENGPWVG